MLENQNNLAVNNTKLINQTYARTDYTTRYTYTMGNKVGIFFSGSTNETPIQETMSGDLDLTIGTNATKVFKVMFTNQTTNSGTLTITGANLPQIIQTETNSIATSQTITYSCQGALVSANATITNTGGLTSNITYQNINSSGKCYYTCTGGYSGNDCSSKVNIVDFFGDLSGKALYQFENNTNDTSGNYNGTATNLTYSPGKFGTGASNIGTTGKMINTSLSVNALSMTVSFFVKFSTRNTANNGTLLQIGNGTNTLTLGLGSSWLSDIVTGYSAGYSTPNTLTNINDNNRHHICITYNGTYQSLVLYIDNNLIATTYTNSGGFPNATGISMGNLVNGTFSPNVNYSVDQLRIFNRPLTAIEVSKVYNEN